MNTDYKLALTTICEYLVENKQRAEYVMNCFFMQDEHDMEEMTKAEGDIKRQEKYIARMQAKQEQTDIIKEELTNFKNPLFINRVSELIHWSMLQLDYPRSYEQRYPYDLKLFLAELKRYDGNIKIVGHDINRRFKYISTLPDLPEK